MDFSPTNRRTAKPDPIAPDSSGAPPSYKSESLLKRTLLKRHCPRGPFPDHLAVAEAKHRRFYDTSFGAKIAVPLQNFVHIVRIVPIIARRYGLDAIQHHLRRCRNDHLVTKKNDGLVLPQVVGGEGWGESLLIQHHLLRRCWDDDLQTIKNR